MEHAIHQGVFSPLLSSIDPMTLRILKLRVTTVTSQSYSTKYEPHGVITLPWETASPTLVADQLMKKAPLIATKFLEREEEILSKEKYILSLKRKFRLRSLKSAVDDNSKFGNCCQKLLNATGDDLIPYLWNLNITISDHYSIENNGTLHIKWDFRYKES